MRCEEGSEEGSCRSSLRMESVATAQSYRFKLRIQFELLIAHVRSGLLTGARRRGTLILRLPATYADTLILWLSLGYSETLSLFTDISLLTVCGLMPCVLRPVPCAFQRFHLFYFSAFVSRAKLPWNCHVLSSRH